MLPLSNSKYPKVRTLNMDQYGANISGTALVPCGTVADIYIYIYIYNMYIYIYINISIYIYIYI